MSGDDHKLESIFEEYQRQRGALTDLHRRVQEISVTHASPRREVEVTVNHGGSLTDITFVGPGYRRLAPRELSDLIMKTLADAKEKAAQESAEIIAPLMPPGINPRDLVAGRLGIEPLAPSDGPRLPQIIREQLQR